VLYLLQQEGMDATAIEDLIYRRSGLLGVSGISSDMRHASSLARSSRARSYLLFVYRIVREIGFLTAALGGLEGIVFSGGIGENDAATRAEVVDGCSWTGAVLDERRNARAVGRIDADSSRIPLLVIPTDEERLIAEQTISLLASKGS
jgi:acetate kinase